MASAFQNRLVGTVVLVAVAVLVLPELLDGKKATLEEQFATIPLRPTVEVAEVSQSLPAKQSAPAWEIEQSQQAPPQPKSNDKSKSVTKSADEAVKAPVEKANSTNQLATKPKVDVGWTLRLGSFKNADNVNRLVAKLREQKYPAYTIPKKPVSGQLTLVMVGPEIDKKRLERVRSELTKKVDIKGTIIRYDPLKM